MGDVWTSLAATFLLWAYSLGVPAFTCPHCKAYASFARTWYGDSMLEGTKVRVEAQQCSNEDCRLIVGALYRGGELLRRWPTHVGGKGFPDVPEQVASAANEAHMCLSIDAHRAATAMARAVVEAIAKHHDIDKGFLDKKIDLLATRGIISDAMRDAAHEIRFAGNEAAHGDLAVDPISREDAEEVVALMDAILLRVYQEPKQVERVREQRLKRRGAVEGGP